VRVDRIIASSECFVTKRSLKLTDDLIASMMMMMMSGTFDALKKHLYLEMDKLTATHG
jgi:hypothetical protein